MSRSCPWVLDDNQYGHVGRPVGTQQKKLQGPSSARVKQSSASMRVGISCVELLRTQASDGHHVSISSPENTPEYNTIKNNSIIIFHPYQHSTTLVYFITFLVPGSVYRRKNSTRRKHGTRGAVSFNSTASGFMLNQASGR